MFSFFGVFKRIFIGEINTPVALFSDVGTKVELKKFCASLIRDGSVHFCSVSSVAHYQEINTTAQHEFLIVTVIVGAYHSSRTTTRHVMAERLASPQLTPVGGDDGSSIMSYDFATVSAGDVASFPPSELVTRIDIGPQRPLTLRRFLSFVGCISTRPSDDNAIDSSPSWFCWIIMHFLTQTCVSVIPTNGPARSSGANMSREEKTKSYNTLFEKYVEKYPEESALDKALNEVRQAAGVKLERLEDQLEELRRNEARLLVELAEVKRLSQ
jgi:hypothetical protein